jgi:HK97 family phage portal protein
VRQPWYRRWFASSTASQQVKASPAFAMPAFQTFVHPPGRPVWMARDYGRFAEEAYIRNVIAHRAVQMVAEGAASVPFALYAIDPEGNRRRITQHPLLKLLARPNPITSGQALRQQLFSYRLIAGNAYLQAVAPRQQPPHELYALRPDRVSIIAGNAGVPQGYRYQMGNQYRDYPADALTGRSAILHLKNFHPLDDWYGLSPIESAAYSIDQHNQAGAWNQALLQNGARPSGALVVKAGDHPGAMLNEEQYYRLKQQVEDQFSGSANAGRPLLLEGGLDWKEMSLSPKDMDFIEAKHSSARDIALAFGVPPQLLGIPGDNTYSNLQEARLSLWEQTILPLAEDYCMALNGWLIPQFPYEGGRLELVCDTDKVSALAYRREKVWERIAAADFLTTDEKRAAVGYGPLSDAASGEG